MLEHEGLLWTWAIEKVPTPGEVVNAERLPDHRLAYLEYQGEIAGGRGIVRRVEAGEYETLETTAAKFRIRLRGQQLGGLLEFAKLEEPAWKLTFAGS
jgi:hypothetical protein